MTNGMERTTCEYDNVTHDCTGFAEWRIWADVTMQWNGACPAAVDALTAPNWGGERHRSVAGTASRGAGRINVVMEVIR
jgi:hypothetical protein